jgi:hypothetical protein
MNMGESFEEIAFKNSDAFVRLRRHKLTLQRVQVLDNGL